MKNMGLSLAMINESLKNIFYNVSPDKSRGIFRNLLIFPGKNLDLSETFFLI